jgi:hypothetical protein
MPRAVNAEAAKKLRNDGPEVLIATLLFSGWFS